MRILAVLILLTLTGCDGPLALLTGGGPKVAANVQVGKTNAQTLGQTNVTEQKLVRPKARRIVQSSDDSRVKAERVETVVVQEYPAWLIVAFAIALFLDSPLRWPGQIVAGLRQARGG
ncbi:hypothetical protein SAMN04490248_1694 [Salinihabitans flavidus]|uniref:Uncharacterized protein n=1 Tax=Salinihabitans flavidus TaxID=569882 RepID=A0A1H8WJR2_9RHOB|nr:bacteriophage spanin2 family protein [Salinihabitans flavidus]SEP27667.1 hypothetical protein SAMN04490248_1694 [Salinihabitans flavidus]